jgi:hypothetical protein
MCLTCTKTAWHMVWSCPASIAVWQECSRRIQKLSLNENDGIGWFTHMKERSDVEELTEAVMVAWFLWLLRNSFVFGREVSYPFQVVQSAKVAVYLVVSQEPLSVRLHEQSPMQLERPEEGLLKMNWDAALSLSKKTMGVGVVLRDEHGVLLAAMAKVVPYVTNPFVAEAVALWRVVSLCGFLGLQRVVFEGYTVQVVQAMCTESPAWSCYAQLLENTRACLQSLKFYSVKHVCQEANKVAHCLAKLAVNQSLDHVWIGECPSSIHNLVLAKRGSFH